MNWVRIVQIVEQIADAFGPVGDQIGDFVLVTAEHLWKRHAIDIEEGANVGRVAEWLISAVMCGLRRVVAGEDHCPESHGVSEGHGRPVP